MIKTTKQSFKQIQVLFYTFSVDETNTVLGPIPPVGHQWSMNLSIHKFSTKLPLK